MWKRSTQQNRRDNFNLRGKLFGHREAISCVCVSQEWSVIVSGTVDSKCYVWDLNRLSHVRCLPDHEGPLVAIAISPVSGDIVTVCQTKKGSLISLFNINGQLFAKAMSPDKILCVKFTGLIIFATC